MLSAMRTPGKFGYIEKTPAGTWKASYSNPVKGDRKRQKRTFQTKSEARTWLDQEEDYIHQCKKKQVRWQSVKEREDRQAQAEKAARTTLKDYATAYVTDYRLPDGTPLAPASMRKKREQLRHLSETAPFWTHTLSGITAEEVTSWRNHELQQIDASPRQKTWQLLKAIMKQAVEEGIIERNPVTGRAPQVPPSKQAQIPIASSEELRIIYENMPEKLRPTIWLGAICGLRINEVCALRVQDIDINRSVLHIRHSVGKSRNDRGARQLKATKNRSSAADKPLSKALIAELTPLIQGRRPEEMLFPAPQAADGIMRDSALRDAFNKAKIKAGRPDLHFHTLRATAIDTAIMSGASLRDTMSFGRHSDVETSVEHYQRAHEDQQRQLVETVSASLMHGGRSIEQIQREIEKTKEQLRLLEAELQQALEREH